MLATNYCLGMNCGKCNTKLQSSYILVNRVRIKCGLYCAICGRQITFSDELRKYQDDIFKEKKIKLKSKPKFQKRRLACGHCLEQGIVNRRKWTLRKMPKKKDETQHWKGTCNICGTVWSQSSGDEYYHYDPKNDPKDMIGAPTGI